MRKYLIEYKNMTEPLSYKKAQDAVLKRYATEPGSKGESQAWKIQSIERIMATPDEQLTGYDLRTFHSFMEDVEIEVNAIEIAVPIVRNLCEKACEPTAVVEKKPAEPTQSLPDNPHGVDLDWN
jgi:hypothetical protein